MTGSGGACLHSEWSRDYVRAGADIGVVATENISGYCTTCYFAYDHLGSVRLVMNQNGGVVARHDYTPYGEEIPAGSAGRNASFGLAVDSAQKFTGQVRDPQTGMDYFNARYLAPAVMQFSSPDPGQAGARMDDPQSWNGYAYVRGNPLGAVDPSGMDPIKLPCSNCSVTVNGGSLNQLDLWNYSIWYTSLRGFNFYQGYDPNSPLFSVTHTEKAPVQTESTPSEAPLKFDIPCYNSAAAAAGMDLRQNARVARDLARTFYWGRPSEAIGAVKTYLNLIAPGGAWDPKDFPGVVRDSDKYHQFTTAGNVNFGVTCAQFGFGALGAQICQLGAGIAAHRAVPRGTVDTTLTAYYSYSHGDQKEDNRDIRIGLALAKECK